MRTSEQSSPLVRLFLNELPLGSAVSASPNKSIIQNLTEKNIPVHEKVKC